MSHRQRCQSSRSQPRCAHSPKARSARKAGLCRHYRPTQHVSAAPTHPLDATAPTLTVIGTSWRRCFTQGSTTAKFKATRCSSNTRQYARGQRSSVATVSAEEHASFTKNALSPEGWAVGTLRSHTQHFSATRTHLLDATAPTLMVLGTSWRRCFTQEARLQGSKRCSSNTRQHASKQRSSVATVSAAARASFHKTRSAPKAGLWGHYGPTHSTFSPPAPTRWMRLPRPFHGPGTSWRRCFTQRSTTAKLKTTRCSANTRQHARGQGSSVATASAAARASFHKNALSPEGWAVRTLRSHTQYFFRRPHPPAGCDCPDPFTVPARPGGVASYREARLQSSKQHDAAQTHDNLPAGRGRRSPRSRPRRARLSTKRAQPRRLGCEDTTVPHTARFRRPHPPAGCDCPDPHGHRHVLAALLHTEKHDCKARNDTMQRKHTTTCPRAGVAGRHGLGRCARIFPRIHVSLRQLELSWGAAVCLPVPLPVLHRPLVRLLLPILPPSSPPLGLPLRRGNAAAVV